MSRALQVAVVAALRGDPGVAAIVGQKVLDRPEPRTPKPYISMGPESFEPLRQDCFKRRVAVLQIDAWTRDAYDRVPCKDLVDAIVGALDQAKLDLAHPHDLSRCDVILARVIDDP
ncbi:MULTISPECIES: DUF3168 domain-containing protein, partial [unclassified Mameliella]|uniref:DUF3168 domain-containing protein n=1 Tax=unclassified Mameliella TaxID=2630630 RepID=UPI00273E7AE3